MPFDAPFALGPFEVHADGRLTLRAPAADRREAPGFRFRWRERPMRAALHGPPETPSLSVQAVAGRVPSSASPEGVAARRRSLAALRLMPEALPEGWHLSLSADHRVVIESSLPLTAPPTATGLLAGVTGFLLALAPYLDLLEEAGFEAGRLSTWPG
jgi:hypothetical protein